jgi:hypothetical protein
MATSAKGRLKRPRRFGRFSSTLIALVSSTTLTTCRSQTCSQAVILPLHTHRESSFTYSLLPSVAQRDVRPSHSSTTIPQTTQATPDQPAPVATILSRPTLRATIQHGVAGPNSRVQLKPNSDLRLNAICPGHHRTVLDHLFDDERLLSPLPAKEKQRSLLCLPLIICFVNVCKDTSRRLEESYMHSSE